MIVPRNYIDLAVFHGKCFKVGWKQGTVFCAPRRIQEPEEMIEEVVPSRKLEIVNVDHLNYGVKINPAEVIIIFTVIHCPGQERNIYFSIYSTSISIYLFILFCIYFFMSISICWKTRNFLFRILSIFIYISVSILHLYLFLSLLEN